MRIETFSSVFPFDIKWQILSFPGNNLVLITVGHFSLTFLFLWRNLKTYFYKTDNLLAIMKKIFCLRVFWSKHVWAIVPRNFEATVSNNVYCLHHHSLLTTIGTFFGPSDNFWQWGYLECVNISTLGLA